MSVRLRLDLQARTEPLGVVRGSVVVDEGGSSRSLEVGLVYREYRGRARRPTGSGHRVRASLQSGDLATGDTFAFALALPADAWPDATCDITGTRMRWEIEARSNQAGRDVVVSSPLSPGDAAVQVVAQSNDDGRAAAAEDVMR